MRTAREAAAAVKIPPRTLSRWMRDAGLPTSKTVLEWYRLLHAAWHLEGGTRKRSAVAQRAGFRSGEALGHTLRQCVGISWAELRDAIGLGGLLGRFDALLRGPRTDSPEVESYRRDDTTS
jgi:transcriptional regulator GlxA family with amidase domain